MAEVFIQYKNTDICFDFTCTCGCEAHYDGYFAYAVKCPKCGEVWSLPSTLELTNGNRLGGDPVVLIADEDNPSVFQ